jgi:hypothetical protein
MDRAYEPRRRSSGVDADPGVGDGDGVSAIASRSFLDLAFLLAAASFYPRMALAFNSMVALVFRGKVLLMLMQRMPVIWVIYGGREIS